MALVGDPFWNLIETDEGRVEKHIQVETIKRIVRSCTSNSGLNLSTTQNIRDTLRASCPDLGNNNKRSKSAPSTPRGRSSDRKKRKVHFAEMAQTDNGPYVSVSTGPGSMADSSPLNYSQDSHDNKENIDLNASIYEPAKKAEVFSSSNCNGDASEPKDKATLKFRWSATKGLPAHLLVLHLRVPFLQKLVTMRLKKESGIFESDDYKDVPVGSHKATMILANREIPTEPVDVKFYTFEADIYLSEEEENKLYKDRNSLGQLKGKATSQDHHTNSNTRTSLFDKRPTLRENKKILDILDIDTVGSESRNQKSNRHTITTDPNVSLPVGCKSNLMSGKATFESKTETSGGYDSKTDTGIIPSGFYKNVEDFHESSSELMPKQFKVPQFNKFSKTTRPSVSSGDRKSGKMEGDTGENDLKNERSSIRRSKIYEKLVAKQMKGKHQSNRSGSLDNLDRDDNHDEEYNRRNRSGSSENRIPLSPINNSTSRYKDTYRSGSERRDSQERSHNGYRSTDDIKDRDSRLHISNDRDRDNRSLIDRDRDHLDHDHRDHHDRDQRDNHDHDQRNHHDSHWSSRNGTEASSSKLTRSGPVPYQSEQELSPYGSSNHRYVDSPSVNRRNNSDTLSSAKSNDQLDSISSSSGLTGKDHRSTRDRDHYRSLDQLSEVSRDKYEPDRRSSDRYSGSEHSSRDQRSVDSSRNKESGYYSDTGHSQDRKESRLDHHNQYGSTNLERYYSDNDVRSAPVSRNHITNGYDSERRDSHDRYERTTDRKGVTFEKDVERQPHIRTPLVTNRTSHLLNKTGTGRGLTADRGEERSKEERMQDLEETVLSLKRVLTEREKELELVRVDKRKLEGDMRDMRDHRGGDHPASVGLIVGQGPVLESQKEVSINTPTEKRINDLIREKENMATEIWQLKRDLDKLQKGQSVPRRDDDFEDSDVNHIDQYNPNNPRILHRKIEEQSSQIKDLQEVNETTANNLIRTEKELDQIKKDNEALRKNRSRRAIDLEDENKSLQNQIDEIKLLNGDSDTDYLRRETEHLREDLRILRDKNHQLIQDNIKLTEHLKDLEIRAERGSSRTGSHIDEDRDELSAQCKRYRKEREAALEEVEFLRKQLQRNRRDGSLNRSKDRDVSRSESNLRGNTDTFTRSTTYQSSTTLVNGHGESKRRERKSSGSDMSDSTAVLTTAHPGFHTSDQSSPHSLPKFTDTRPSHYSNHNHNFDDACDTVDDVIDDLPRPVHSSRHSTSKGKYQPKLSVVEDIVGSNENLAAAIDNITNSVHKSPPKTVAPVDQSDQLVSDQIMDQTTSSNTIPESSIESTKQDSDLFIAKIDQQLKHMEILNNSKTNLDTSSLLLNDYNSKPDDSFSCSLNRSKDSNGISVTKSNRKTTKTIEDDGSVISSIHNSSSFNSGNYRSNINPSSNNNNKIPSEVVNTFKDTSTTISDITNVVDPHKAFNPVDKHSSFNPRDPHSTFNPIEHPYKASTSHQIEHPQPAVCTTTQPSLKQKPREKSVQISARHSSGKSNVSESFCETTSTSWLIDEISDMDSISCVGINPKSQELTTNKSSSSSTNNNLLSSYSLTNSYNQNKEFPTPLEVNYTTTNFRKRSNSVNSDCTDFLMGDVEQMVENIGKQSQSMKEYSTSMVSLPLASDNTGFKQQSQQRVLQNSHQQQTFKSLSNLDQGKLRINNDHLAERSLSQQSCDTEVLHNSSLRSVSPKPVATQHNKHLLGSSTADDHSMLMATRRPFCPRSPADINLEDLVKFSRQGGKISRGIVKYVGHLPGKNDTYLGVELEHEIGKHDGLYDGQRYFQCKPNKGVFVAFTKVVMAWGS